MPESKEKDESKRIGWLDSANMPSHIHKTLDDGITTVCGHDPRYKSTIKRWTIDSTIPRKIKGTSRYCKICFADGGKSLPWIES